MRRAAVAIFAVMVVVPVAIPASSADAATVPSCAGTGTLSFSPALPIFGDPTTVVPTITGTETFSGCVGMGVTGGTAVFSAASSEEVAQNCDTRLLNGTAGEGQGANVDGTTIVTWNTGQTSTLTGFFPGGYTVVSGLFQGASIGLSSSFQVGPPGFCQGVPLTTATITPHGRFEVILGSGFVACASPQFCQETQSAPATATAPGLQVTVRARPSTGVGTIALTIATGSLPCPTVPTTPRPVANLTDTGLPKSDKLTVTATLPVTSATNPEQVCFNSAIAFRSQTNPIIPKAGTALLLDCTKVKGSPPCVTSRGPNVVTFVVPGGDPRFSIVLPKGRQVWAAKLGTGKVGTAYTAHLYASGGIRPITWTISSGNLPKGCLLNPRTGVITGTPTKKGSYSAVVKATDAEKPPKTAVLTVPIKIN